MIDILNKYLVQQKSINIPGLGTLYLERVPAHTDMESGQVFPPAYTLRFDKYFDAPDKAFFTYLASQKKIPDYEAIKLYNQFAQDIRSAIKFDEKAVWKDLGTFTKDDSGEVVFQPDSQLLQPFAPVTAEKIIGAEIHAQPAVSLYEEAAASLGTETPMPVMERKDHWRKYALLLGVIGLLILLYQLARYGFSWEAIANRQPFK